MKGLPPPHCTQLSGQKPRHPRFTRQADDPNAPVTIFINSGGGLVELAGCQWIRDCLWKSKDFLLILKHCLLNCANMCQQILERFCWKADGQVHSGLAILDVMANVSTPLKTVSLFQKKTCENSLATHMDPQLFSALQLSTRSCNWRGLLWSMFLHCCSAIGGPFLRIWWRPHMSKREVPCGHVKTSMIRDLKLSLILSWYIWLS